MYCNIPVWLFRLQMIIVLIFPSKLSYVMRNEHYMGQKQSHYDVYYSYVVQILRANPTVMIFSSLSYRKQTGRHWKHGRNFFSAESGKGAGIGQPRHSGLEAHFCKAADGLSSCLPQMCFSRPYVMAWEESHTDKCVPSELVGSR